METCLLATHSLLILLIVAGTAKGLADIASNLKCNLSLGIESGHLIPTSVSHAEIEEHGVSLAYTARSARLHRKKVPDCWASSVGYFGLEQQVVQINFPQLMRITGVSTQGCPSQKCWLRTYSVQYSSVGSKGPYIPLRADDQTVLFPANRDVSGMVHNRISPSIPAKSIRLVPRHYHQMRCLRMEVYGCPWKQDASDPVGISDGRLSDKLITASSYWPGDFSRAISWAPGDIMLPSYARLNHHSSQTGGGWCAYGTSGKNYLQVDLLSSHKITAIATQGIVYHGIHIAVKGFHTMCSVDGHRFHQLTTLRGSLLFLRGGSAHRVISNQVVPSAMCRFVRLTNFVVSDETAYKGAPPCVRMELYGCDTTVPGCSNNTPATLTVAPATETKGETATPIADAVADMGKAQSQSAAPSTSLTTSSQPDNTLITTSSHHSTHSTHTQTSQNIVNLSEQFTQPSSKAADSEIGTHTQTSQNIVNPSEQPTQPSSWATDSETGTHTQTSSTHSHALAGTSTALPDSSSGKDSVQSAASLMAEVTAQDDNSNASLRVGTTSEILSGTVGASAAKNSGKRRYPSMLKIAVPVALVLGSLFLLIAVLIMCRQRRRLMRLAKDSPYQRIGQEGSWSTPESSDQRTDIYAVPTTQRDHRRGADNVIYESAAGAGRSAEGNASSGSQRSPPPSASTRERRLPLERTLAAVQPSVPARLDLLPGTSGAVEGEERYVSGPMMFPDPRSAGDPYENVHDIVN